MKVLLQVVGGGGGVKGVRRNVDYGYSMIAVCVWWYTIPRLQGCITWGCKRIVQTYRYWPLFSLFMNEDHPGSSRVREEYQDSSWGTCDTRH